MKLYRLIFGAATTGALLMTVVVPSTSLAHEEESCHHGMQRPMAMENRGQWVKNQMAKEAAWLEIKASQQEAWEAFAAANLELSNAFGDRQPPMPDVDAATVVRQHAEHAAAFAQSLSKLATATEKLQSVLNEDQRKVLNRIVSLHSQFRGAGFSEGMAGMADHEHCQSRHESAHSGHGPKSAAPAKPKN